MVRCVCTWNDGCRWALRGPLSAEEWLSIGPFGLAIPNQDVIDGQANVVAVDPRSAPRTIYLGTAEEEYGKPAMGDKRGRR